jgi:hypothetical protein
VTCEPDLHSHATVDAFGYLEEPFRLEPCMQAATYRLLMEHRVGENRREVIADMQAKTVALSPPRRLTVNRETLLKQIHGDLIHAMAIMNENHEEADDDVFNAILSAAELVKKKLKEIKP